MKLYVEMKKIKKRFGYVIANDEVDFTAYTGEIHSIVGGNGAGKTTLMKILYGMIQPDSGEIFLNGEKIEIKSSRDAIAKNIGMVHQEFLFIENMDAVNNIILGSEPVKNLIIDKKNAIEKIISLQEKYHLFFDVEKQVNELSMGERQRIEIMKILYRNAKILIFDEPTGILTPQESKKLFDILYTLRDRGALIIFISHKLQEVLEISDKISIMREGKIIETLSSESCDIRELAIKMIGGDLPQIEHKQYLPSKKVIFSVKNLSTKDKKVKNVSFDIKSGEIFGIAGIEGNGQKELEESLAGIALISEGMITINNEILNEISPKSFKDKGVSLIPSNRNKLGLISEFKIYENLILGYHNSPHFSHFGFLNYNEIYKNSKEIIEDYEITPPDINRLVKHLSGGNQQKIVLGREISKNPLFLISAYPTRGVDIKGTWFIHNKLKEMKKNGMAILLISSDLDELFMLCDRIGVMYDGEIIDIVIPQKTTFEEIGLLMLGGKPSLSQNITH